ncbi:hypothetical protein WJX81_005210 [Elliptochloris bilobata]|uniref:Exocyst complex component EXOC2/Sec5 N-terminal domain-containing protein n=1 Tax=Elliptochloris bilobata TaxID=381761 RepID=A0AAW1RSZ0_9CHLO
MTPKRAVVGAVVFLLEAWAMLGELTLPPLENVARLTGIVADFGGVWATHGNNHSTLQAPEIAYRTHPRYPLGTRGPLEQVGGNAVLCTLRRLATEKGQTAGPAEKLYACLPRFELIVRNLATSALRTVRANFIVACHGVHGRQLTPADCGLPVDPAVFEAVLRDCSQPGASNSLGMEDGAAARMAGQAHDGFFSYARSGQELQAALEPTPLTSEEPLKYLFEVSLPLALQSALNERRQRAYTKVQEEEDGEDPDALVDEELEDVGSEQTSARDGNRSEAFFDGPQTWEEVDVEELQRIAVNIARAAVPSAESLEVGARLAMQAAAMEAESADPLGLGRVDTRGLALVRHEAKPQAPAFGRMRSLARTSVTDSAALRQNLFRRSMVSGASVPAARRRSMDEGSQGLEDIAASRKDKGGRGAMESIATGISRRGMLYAGSSIAVLRSKVQPASEQFDPDVYLGLVHGDTSLGELRAGLANLRLELSERTGQLKALVKENFDRFISCKTTIDDIHVRLRQAERGLQSGSGAVSTSDMVSIIHEVQNEARRAFGALLERASASDRIRGVLALLKRYENLFRLPTRIRQAAEKELYEQVISEYHKARALMADVAAQAKEGVWHNLFLEVVKVVEEMAERLAAVLRDASTSPSRAIEAVKHLLTLQADGARCVADCDPLGLYLDAQDQNLHALMDAAAEEHVARLQHVEDAAVAVATAPSLAIDLASAPSLSMKPVPSGVAAAEPERKESAEELWEGYVAELTSILLRHLPDLWHVLHDKLATLMDISAYAREVIEAGADDAGQLVDIVLEQYSASVVEALREIAGAGGNRAALLGASRRAASGLLALRAAAGPPAITAALRKVLEAAAALAVEQLAAERSQLVAALGDTEDWTILAASHKAGNPVSAVPGRLRAALAGGLELVEALVAEAARADDPCDSPVDIAGRVALSLRTTFFESFTLYAAAVDQLADHITAAAASGTPVAGGGTPTRGGVLASQGGPGAAGATPPDRKLLVLLSNCAYVRSSIMPGLMTRFGVLLATEGAVEDCRTMSEECTMDLREVEGRLAGAYVAAKAAALDDRLEELLFADAGAAGAAPLPSGVRGAAVEVANCLVAVEAETFSSAPGLRRRVLGELLQHLLDTFAGAVPEHLGEASLGVALQLAVELEFLAAALAPVPAPLEAAFAAARAPVLARAEAAAGAGDPLAGTRLERWLNEGKFAVMLALFLVEERWSFDNPPPWHKQFTVRGTLVGAVISVALSFIVIKLELTTGIMPSLSMATSLIAFGLLKAYTALMTRLGWRHAQFTPQENVLIQTWAGCLSGSIGINLLALDLQSYLNIGNVPGNRRDDVYQPTLNLVLPYYISTAVIGLLPLVFLRHMFILRYRLPFPSGTATAVMINGLHTASGSAEGMRQLRTLCQWGGVSLFWSCFKWFFSAGASADASVASCGGFSSWPTFGFKALNLTWNFDSSLTYIGVGMICPHWVNYSMMVGAITSWGIMWPLIRGMAGHWYPAGLNEKDFNGLFGYQVFIAIAVFLGDGIYNLLKTVYLSVESYRDQRRRSRSLPDGMPPAEPATAAERHAAEIMARNDEIFAQDHVSMWWCAAGYVASCALAIGIVPALYPPAKWYYLLIGLVVAPLLAVGNAYGTGLTDWNMSSLYTKLAIFSIAAWAGAERGGVVAGLIAGDLIGGIAGTPANLLGDWKTAHLTRTSVLSMFIVTLVGGFIGCLPGPLIFQIFWKAFPIGDPTSDYKVPYASIYRGLAIMGTQGFGALPRHCSYFMTAFFFGAIAVNALRDAVGLRWPRAAAVIPVPMAMAIPFYIGANVAVDMALGSVVKAAWFLVSPQGAFGLCIAAASGLIVGDGIWSIFDANLALFKVAQPFCISFSRGAVHHS